MWDRGCSKGTVLRNVILVGVTAVQQPWAFGWLVGCWQGDGGDWSYSWRLWLSLSSRFGSKWCKLLQPKAHLGILFDLKTDCLEFVGQQEKGFCQFLRSEVVVVGAVCVAVCSILKWKHVKIASCYCGNGLILIFVLWNFFTCCCRRSTAENETSWETEWLCWDDLFLAQNCNDTGMCQAALKSFLRLCSEVCVDGFVLEFL